MDEAREGEPTGAGESIEANVDARSRESQTHIITLIRSRREWSRWESCDMDEARKGERAGAGESIEANVDARSRESQTHIITLIRSRRESNPHLRFRKPLFYPLNYGNKL